MTNKTKTAAALLSSAMLATAGVSAFAPALAVADEEPAAVEQAAQGAEAATAAVKAEGTFSWQQAGLTSFEYIKAAFQKAAALCASMPAYSVQVADGTITVTTAYGTFSATIQDIASKEGLTSFVLACACASNLAGGGAVANAQVEGVSVASVASAAGVL